MPEFSRRHLVFLGLGSNIDPENNLRCAATLLRKEFPAIVFSSVYRSSAMYEEKQPDFLNAVARTESSQTLEEILEILQRIEVILKKNPPKRFGPRTIDLDILLFDNLILPDKKTRATHSAKLKTLVIPHVRMHERRFVLAPLRELLDSRATHPVLGTSWQELLKKTEKQSCEKASLIL